jgi:hypothetical protein
VLTYGFTYKNVTTEQAKKNDSSDLTDTHILIDSALYFYNTASVILGGMTSAENYQAALVFAKIAKQTNEQQYKDIAIDFLNLLLVRKELTKSKLKKQPEFKALIKEQRWIDVCKQLE